MAIGDPPTIEAPPTPPTHAIGALDNRTACFGDNADGVRNPSSPVGLEADASAVPELIEGVGSTQSLAVRSGTACAIDEDGLKCWGRSAGFATGRIRVISFDPPAPEQIALRLANAARTGIPML